MLLGTVSCRVQPLTHEESLLQSFIPDYFLPELVQFLHLRVRFIEQRLSAQPVNHLTSDYISASLNLILHTPEHFDVYPIRQTYPSPVVQIDLLSVMPQQTICRMLSTLHQRSKISKMVLLLRLDLPFNILRNSVKLILNELLSLFDLGFGINLFLINAFELVEMSLLH